MLESKVKFLNYIQFEKRYSNNTLIAYKNDLEKFFDFLKIQYNIEQLSEIQHTFIRSWLIELKINKIANKSINRKLSTLKSFYKFLLREKLVETNPMNKVISPKNEQRLPVIIEEGKLNTFLDYLNKDENILIKNFNFDGVISTPIVDKELFEILSQFAK